MKSISWRRALAGALSLACIGLGDASSQPLAPETAQAPSVSSTANVGGETSFIGKSYNVGGMIRVSGNIGNSISNANGTITASVDKITNDSSTTTSGALRLRMFVSSVPFDQSVAYYTVGEAMLNPLAPLGSYTNLSVTMPLSIPPDGVYYMNIGIFEQEAGCPSEDGFCPDAAATFPTQVQVQMGVFYSYTPTSSTATAVEYYHAAFNHYFFTANPDEISQLDSGHFAGWARTGESFGVWNFDIGGLSAVCRFFSTAFDPKSSHFYTPISNECAIVKTNPNWQYEGIVAYFLLPLDDGTCAMGMPLYRLYNNGMGGAPNHRYTISLGMRSSMIAAGWIPEGSGIGVIGCVPN